MHDPVSTGGETEAAPERRLGAYGACCLSCLNPVTDPGTYSSRKRCAACADLMAVALREAEDLIAKNGGGADGPRPWARPPRSRQCSTAAEASADARAREEASFRMRARSRKSGERMGIH